MYDFVTIKLIFLLTLMQCVDNSSGINDLMNTRNFSINTDVKITTSLTIMFLYSEFFVRIIHKN